MSNRVPEPLRILVADDNEMLVVAVSGLLQNLGHSVDIVSNGHEAVELATREDFDVIFLDMQMPVMGGFEAAHTIKRGRSRKSPAWIVGISGEAPDSDPAMIASLDDFLIKPVRLADLVRILSDRLAVG